MSRPTPARPRRARRQTRPKASLNSLALIHCLLLLASGARLWAADRALLPESFEDSAANRWLKKQVLASRLLDDMAGPAHWSAFTTGVPQVVDARAAQETTEPRPGPGAPRPAGFGVARGYGCARVPQ